MCMFTTKSFSTRVCVSSFQGSHHVAIVESLRKLFCNVKFSVLFFLLLSSNFPLMKKKETSKYRTPTFKSVPSFPRQFCLRLQTRLIILAVSTAAHLSFPLLPSSSYAAAAPFFFLIFTFQSNFCCRWNAILLSTSAAKLFFFFFFFTHSISFRSSRRWRKTWWLLKRILLHWISGWRNSK